MNYWEFIKTFGDSPNIKELAKTTEFEPAYTSFKTWLKGYHLAYYLGLNPSDDAVEFRNKFKFYYDDERVSAKKEGLSYTDWCCKHDDWSIWYAPFWHKVADGELSTNYNSATPCVYDEIEKHREEITKQMTSNSPSPIKGDTYTTKSGVTVSASRITAEDLKKYAMPAFGGIGEEVLF